MKVRNKVALSIGKALEIEVGQQRMLVAGAMGS